MRGDDGVGVRIATVLEPALAARGGVAIATHQLLPEHAESISRARVVIVVDASCTLAAGRVAWRKLRDDKDAVTIQTVLGHHGDPVSLLALSRTLYDQAPKAVLVSIGVHSLALGDKLSPAVARAEGRVIRQIAALAKQPARARMSTLRRLCAAGCKRGLIKSSAAKLSPGRASTHRKR